MAYIIGAAIGILVGTVVALLKDKILWGGRVQKASGDAQAPDTEPAPGVPEAPAAEPAPYTAAGIYARVAISFAVNVITLVVIFLFRENFAFGPWACCIVGAALSLGILNMVLASRRAKR